MSIKLCVSANLKFSFTRKLREDQLVAAYGETIGKALQFYTKQYGAPEMGKKIDGRSD